MLVSGKSYVLLFRNSVLVQRRFSSSCSSTKRYIPRRALMYVPGNDERKLGKIPNLGADCVVLDCEDGVAINKKEDARNMIRKILDDQSISFGKAECTVRINSVQSGLYEEDLERIMKSKNLPSSLLLPKVESVTDLKSFLESSTKILLSVGRDKGKDKMNLIMLVESAQGMLNVPQVCQAAWDLSDTSFFVPDALVFGSDDYCADIGATRTKGGDEVLYARQHTVMVAKAFRLQAIDMVYIDFKDNEGLKQQAILGSQMGFTGKQIIHPNQIATCQEAFTPSPEKITWAKELIKEFDLHQKTGKGAFNFRGSMIDMPSVLQARNIVQLVERITS